MAIKYQFNKTSLGELGKQLKMRTKALPTLKSKESALRMEVKKAKDEAAGYARQMEELTAQYDYMAALWEEFDTDLVKVGDVETDQVKIAGVRIPVLREVVFLEAPYDLFTAPSWTGEGIGILKSIATLGVEHELCTRRRNLLEHARKKTTQKVNLYEKVQIPGYEDAIRKIKRFLEDEENLSKSAQKIVKNRQQAQSASV